jgi:ATP-dependent RNA helicase RhlB
MVKKLIQKIGRKVFGTAKTSPRKPSPAKPAGRGKPSASPEQSFGDAQPRKRRKRRRRPRGGRPAGERWSLDTFQVPPKEGETRFHDFNLPVEIMHAVYDLGFKYCTPIQAKVLRHAGGGRDIAGRAQTGTGKTAAFLICIFTRFLAERAAGTSRKPGVPRALVIAPTRELVIQIIKDFDRQRRELLKHPVDLIAATPGRLLDFVRRRVLDLKRVDVLVIDEADRMLDMGFIPDVRRIIHATPSKDKRQTMLYSATLTSDVLQLSSQWMTDPEFCEVDPEQVAVDTVEQVVYVVTVRDKFKLLCNLLADDGMKRVLIFGNRRDSTGRLADKLHRSGIRCEYLSGAVRQEKRLKVLDDFRNGRIRVIVATDVAGRGLHVDDITHVVNYEFPHEPEDYVHRIGRTGRAGVKGTAISFACEAESFVIPDIEEYIGQSLPCRMVDPDLLEKGGY